MREEGCSEEVTSCRGLNKGINWAWSPWKGLEAPFQGDRVHHLGKQGGPRGRQVLRVSCMSEGRAVLRHIPQPLRATQSPAHKGRGAPARAPGVPAAQGLPLSGARKAESPPWQPFLVNR